MGDEIVEFVGEHQVRQDVEAVFQRLRARIATLLPKARVEHVGATAVAGSITKGDLDICVLVEPTHFAEAEAALAGEFARNLGSDHTDDFAAFCGVDGAVEIGIQLAVAGGQRDFFTRWRDQLAADSGLLKTYNELKARFQGKSMTEYRLAKASFIEEHLR